MTDPRKDIKICKVIEINKTKRITKGQYHDGALPKKQIYLHHTAGTTAAGAIGWWNQTPERVGTAYVIDRDGTIYETFDPKSYAYHLGIKGDSDAVERNSVGIEIVSAGRVHKEGEKFMFYPLFPNKTSKQEIPAEDVIELNTEDKRWVGFFHKYSDKQVDSIIGLIQNLNKDLNMGLTNPKPDFYEYNKKVVTDVLPGIWSHSTVRTDKIDIIPQPNFLEALSKVF